MRVRWWAFPTVIVAEVVLFLLAGATSTRKKPSDSAGPVSNILLGIFLLGLLLLIALGVIAVIQSRRSRAT